MYGKIFESTFTGSLFGSGPTVFAVWAYVISKAYDGHVELNPKLLAACIGTEPEDIRKAIAFLCQPDPESRNSDEQGRRLVSVEGFQYYVPSWQKYHDIRNVNDRRDYMREYMRNRRAMHAEVSSEQRSRIFERDGYKCRICGSRDDLCIDHIIPVTKGGDNADENLQTLCKPCNIKKNDVYTVNVNADVNIEAAYVSLQSDNVNDVNNVNAMLSESDSYAATESKDTKSLKLVPLSAEKKTPGDKWKAPHLSRRHGETI
jgi:5-methylcytosine-specific restriction endonuclease McrA